MKVRDIEERTLQFGVRIMHLSRTISRSNVDYVLARQLLRAGTSVGANVAEAQGATTRREFARKMAIAHGEAREAHYWLRLIRETGVVKPEQLVSILDEAEQLIRILVAIVKRSRMEKKKLPVGAEDLPELKI